MPVAEALPAAGGAGAAGEAEARRTVSASKCGMEISRIFHGRLLGLQESRVSVLGLQSNKLQFEPALIKHVPLCRLRRLPKRQGAQGHLAERRHAHGSFC